jgi:hypothetical protein
MYENIIIPTVLYGLESWFFNLLEDHRLRVLGIRVLEKIIGIKLGGSVRSQIALHSQELRSFHSLLDIIKLIKPRSLRLTRSVAPLEGMRNLSFILDV